jgi:hypothetical protein
MDRDCYSRDNNTRRESVVISMSCPKKSISI